MTDTTAKHTSAKKGLIVELKVVTSTLTATAVGIGVAILNGVEANHELLGSLGPTYQALILAIVPGALTFLVAYQTKHTPRPDLDTPAP